MSLKNYSESYDVCIIGSGIGGLVAACVLSRSGLKVAVFERSDTEGGYLMGFTRHRFTFDTAIHWLNQCMPGGMVHFIFESFGTDYPSVTRQKRVKRIIGDDFEYLLTNNPDELKEELCQKFPEDRSGIQRFFADAKKTGIGMTSAGRLVRSTLTMNFFEKISNIYYSIKFVKRFIPFIRFSGKEGFQKGLHRYFKNEKLKQLFSSEKDLLSCLIPIGWAYSGDFLNPPVGGSQSFAAWLKYVSQSHGIDFFTYANVEKIIIHSQQAVGIEVNHRGTLHTINANYIIAACDIENLYKNMLPQTLETQKILDNLNKAEMYDSSFTIHVALNCEAALLGFNEEMIFISKQDVSYEDHTGGDPHKTEILVLAPSFRDNTLAPSGKGTITIFMPALQHHQNYWGAEKDASGNWVRGEAYKKKKEEVANILIQRVSEKLQIDLLSHIEFYEAATPFTHERYSGNRHGTMMGTRPGKINYQLKVANYKTPFKNVLIGGHWAELGGGVPIAAKAGFNAALEIIRQTKPDAFKAYINYVNGKIDAEAIRNHAAFLRYTNSWKRKSTPSELLKARRNSDNLSS